MLCGTEHNATMIMNVKQDEEEKVVIDHMKQVS